MTKLRRGRLFLGVAALALAVAGLAAATGGDRGTWLDAWQGGKAEAVERHCVADVTTGATQCFGTFREAIQHATAGRVTDANLSAQTATADSKTTAKLNSGERGIAALVIGIQYLLGGLQSFPGRKLAYARVHTHPFG